ncbi:heterokaryon incompatibility protein-domain-containing protein [Hypoxylon fuscum]|nr:heterokaryon incompatibility protein-domain-containing protein [Hypoxylon fuscum]
MLQIAIQMDTQYQYRPLDQAKSEIRVLAILPESDGLVHCVLDNVSLEDYTPEFSCFMPNLSRGKRSDHWFRTTSDSTATEPLQSNSDTTHPIRMPKWRRDIDSYNDEEFKTYALGVDTSVQLTEWVKEGDVYSIRILTEGETKERRSLSAESEQSLAIKPRFKWGDYEALSYSWGSEKRERHIILNNTHFPVPKNLEAALQKLRTLPEVKSGMRLWIDALCINQDDIYEKNHQVRQMQTIYTIALGVVVWLGDVTNGMEDMVASMFSAACMMADPGASINPRLLRTDLSSFPETDIFPFFVLEYWYRIWIIQELALNHRATIFLYGNRQLPRRVIRNAASFAINFIPRSRRAIDQEQYSAAEHVMYIISMSTQISDLDRIHQLMQGSNAKDPRDKIYGLLGLLPSSITKRITPDYSLSKEKVYLQIGEAILMECKSLDKLLSWSSFREKVPWPSWLPDWTVPLNNRRHITWLRKRKAGGHALPQYHIVNEAQTLSVKGVIVVSVKTLSAGTTTAAEWCVTDVETRNRYGDRREISMALQKTLVMEHPHTFLLEPAVSLLGLESIPQAIISNIWWLDREEKEEIEDSCPYLDGLWGSMEEVTRDKDWRLFEDFRHRNANFSVFGYPFRSFFLSPRTNQQGCCTGRGSCPSLIPSRLTYKDRHNMNLCVISLLGRRLMTTETGYMGMVPETVKLGDIIAVLHGCNFPVMLRPHRNGYHLIGECYVHGLMDGEAVLSEESREFEEKDIILY